MSLKLAVDRAAFTSVYDTGAAQLVWARLADDLETPVSAFLKFGRDRKNAFLLESVEGGNWRGRYSIIGFDPDIIWRITGDHAEIARGEDVAVRRFVRQDEPPLTALRTLLAESKLEIPEDRKSVV